MFKNKKILFLSPHPDDIEFYCGGTLSKIIDSGNEVMNIAFSDCAQSIPDGFPSDILKMEFMQAMKTAGVNNYKLKECPVRRFNEHRQDILEYMISVNKEFNPNIVFLPSVNDIHQDHEVIRKEALRAFKNKCLISYEVPLNSFDHSFNLVIELSQNNIDKKLEIIKCYKSQVFRNYSNPEFIISSAVTAGAYVQKQYAETFKIIKWIG